MGDTFSLQEKIVELDKKDGHILTELALNSRRPFSHLARAVGLSEPALKLRMKKLVGKGVIAGFAPCLNFNKLGLNHYRCLFRMTKTTREQEKEIIQYLLNNKNVFRVARTRWKWDLCVDFISRDADSFFKLLNETTRRFPDNLNKYDLLCSAYLILFRRRFNGRGMDVEDIRLFGGTNQKEELDKIDFGILDALLRNARATNHRIGKDIGAAPATVKKRIDAMEKKGIIYGYSAFICPWLARGVFENVLIKFHENADAERRLHEFARSEPSVLYLGKTMTEMFTLDIGCCPSAEFTDLMRRLKDSFADTSFEYEVIEIADMSSINCISVSEV